MPLFSWNCSCNAGIDIDWTHVWILLLKQHVTFSGGFYFVVFNLLQVMEMGMNFLAADDMKTILAVKLRKRLGFGIWAKMHITGMHIEGRVWSIIMNSSLEVKLFTHFKFCISICIIKKLHGMQPPKSWETSGRERGRQPWSSSSGHRCLILEREILLPSLHLELKNLSLENYKEILIKGWHPTSYPQGILNTWSGRCLKYHPSHLTARLDFLVWFTNLTKNYQHWVMQRKNK